MNKTHRDWKLKINGNNEDNSQTTLLSNRKEKTYNVDELKD